MYIDIPYCLFCLLPSALSPPLLWADLAARSSAARSASPRAAAARAESRSACNTLPYVGGDSQ